MSDPAKRHYDRATAFINAAKAVPCADCGIQYPSYVMDFDHRDPSTKEFGIGCNRKSVSRSRLEAEIAKCDVVCANCHRFRTFAFKERS